MKASDFTTVSTLLTDRGKLGGKLASLKEMHDNARYMNLNTGYFSDSLKGVTMETLLTDEHAASRIIKTVHQAARDAIATEIEALESRLSALGVEVDQ